MESGLTARLMNSVTAMPQSRTVSVMQWQPWLSSRLGIRAKVIVKDPG